MHLQATLDNTFSPGSLVELKQRGHTVQAPQLPHSDAPVEHEQTSTVPSCHFSKDTIILGHSLGAVIAPKLLEKINHLVNGLILVGGFFEPLFKDRKRPFESSFRWSFDFTKISFFHPCVFHWWLLSGCVRQSL